MKLIVNADDFGYSKGVSLGIVEAHRNGVVSSATMMVNMPGFGHAVQLAEENPKLGVGIHLVLTCGSAVHPQVASLTDDAGAFRRGQQHLHDAIPEEVEREFVAQIERFLQSGLPLTHLDSHHHVHAHEAILPIVLRLAERYQVPIRNPWTLAGNRSNKRIVTTEGFSHRFYRDNLTPATFMEIMEELKGYATAEIMSHPAYLDEDVLVGSSYNLARTRELQILTSTQVKDYVKQNGIQLVTFKDIG
ncbi:chitin disaccharide deacetylase [Brevibacillus sp. AY1]|uniref:chitin disaccharide deacetylase n=1 Tax=Brevibacillus sp. AY1 TaxID=2807621 RepID=UPI002457064F|nr:chitin disaccharide deacetylase [Brevibacillus sp. AY1]MDH4617451.1 chitin disaccharide deacetylase [Brevibacillus sp. AY1]